MKKKRWLKQEIKLLKQNVDEQREINKKLLDIIEQQNKRIDSLERIQNTNTLATNSNFAKLESKLGDVEIDLEKAIIKFNQSKKKSWFGKH